MVSRENKSNTYAKFWRDKQRVLCIFESGLLSEQNARARTRLGSPFVLGVLFVLACVREFFARLLISRRN